jgi:hypothetical protein
MKYFKLLIVIAIIGIFGTIEKAGAIALTSCTLSELSGTYSEIAGTVVGAGDDVVYTFPVPFSFQYDNQTFSSGNYAVSTNGYMNLAGNTSSSLSLYVNTYANVIAWCAEDLILDQTNSNIQYLVTGTAPNRVLIVQWTNVRYYGGAGNMYCQIKLYETSNQIDIAFGGLGSPTFDASTIGFTGSSTSNYINIEPGSTSTFYYSTTNPNTNRLITTTTGPSLANKTYRLTSYPTLLSATPAPNAVLQLGQVYGTGNINKPGISINNFNNRTDVYVRYKIYGPTSSSNPQTIYTAHQPNVPTQEWYNATSANFQFPAAKGTAAGVSPNDGRLDLTSSELVGGIYNVETYLEIRTSATATPTYTSPTMQYTINIALPNDIEVTSIPDPKSRDVNKYPQNQFIPITAVVTNIGSNPVSLFRTIGHLSRNGVEFRTDTVLYDSNVGAPLQTGQSYTCNFGNYWPSQNGDFSFWVETELLSASDMNLSNNRLPRLNDTLICTVAYQVDPRTDTIFKPFEGEQLRIGRPIIPSARFANEGIDIVSNVPVRMQIFKYPNLTNPIYQSNTTVLDIPSGRFNTASVQFPDIFIPTQPGNYQVCIYTLYGDDPVPTNNTECQDFSVTYALEGLYTIGTLYAGQPRNYLTLQAAADDLFNYGISGPVTFELTDAYYEAGSTTNLLDPALDLSSKIIGTSSTNTITFRPSAAMAETRESITINLKTGSGVGILLGQNSSSANGYAAVNLVYDSKKRDFANPPGGASYITFDGGANKSFRFSITTSSMYRAVFYLGQGASSNTIKNCIIKDGIYQTASDSSSLPMTYYNTAMMMFVYDKDKRDNGRTYSSGIVLRSKPPRDSKTGINSLVLDTLVNKNNVVENCEISGFGYGIVSLGAGVLFKQGDAVYTKYYNSSNTFKNNKIYNVNRCGIFLGYESNTTVVGNNIYSVKGSGLKDIAGIIVGGDGGGGYNGYNNYNITIDRNEIHNLMTTTTATQLMLSGIKVESARNSFPFVDPPQVHFPDVDENITITNNIVWGITANRFGSRFGIRVMTERAPVSVDMLLPNLNVSVPGYWVRNTKIANNTIIIPDDGTTTSAFLAGIAVQHAQNTTIMNNAVAALDNTINNTTVINSAYFFEGLHPETGTFISDRNAAQLAANAAFYVFMETDDNSVIVDGGTSTNRNDYKTISQWQNWTGQDMNSAIGTFTNDLVYLGTAPDQKLRMTPNPSIGSILNNRGNRLTWVTEDIDGAIRGTGGQRYDIGAIEYDGTLYISMAEVISIPWPSAYRSGSGTFSDAEYVMTKAPVDIIARFRNGGSLPLSAIATTAKVYIEDPANPGQFLTEPVLNKQKLINIASTETVESSFGLGTDAVTGFVPQTYLELADAGYVVPNMYSTMAGNVTPLYKIEVGIASDTYTENSTISKIVRFYLKKATNGLLISAENSFDLTNANANLLAGRLNVDSLRVAMATLAMKFTTNATPADSVRVDLFDRKAWEQKTVDYTLYRTLFWSDGSENALSRYEIRNITDFANSGNAIDKRNLIISSQEMFRLNRAANPDFVRNYLRADTVRVTVSGTGYTLDNPLSTVSGTTMNLYVSNSGNRIRGRYLAPPETTELIQATGVAGDADPWCSIMKLIPETEAEGETLIAYGYKNYNYIKGARADSLSVNAAGTIWSTVTRNGIYLGIDWRHFANLSNVLRSMQDYISRRSSDLFANDNPTPIPVAVEVFDFTAIARQRQVELNWTTKSEIESERFVVERSAKNESGLTQFAPIAEVKAAGYSTATLNYGPVVDRDVELGSTYVYRLYEYDKNGERKFCDEVEVSLEPSETNWLGDVRPNPSSEFVRFNLNVVESGIYTVEFIDANGQVATRANIEVQAGMNTVEFTTAPLASGVYRIVVGNGQILLNTSVSVVK